MKLVGFEKQVLQIMLQGRLDREGIKRFIDTATVSNYEHTGAGYYLEIKSHTINLKKETIHQPLVSGSCENIVIGFVLFTDNDTVTLECHGWGEANLTKDVRAKKVDIVL